MKTYYVIKHDMNHANKYLGCIASTSKELFRELNPFSIEWQGVVKARDMKSAIIGAREARKLK